MTTIYISTVLTVDLQTELNKCRYRTSSNNADLPTFHEIKAKDLPPFGKKTRKIFMLGKYSDILSRKSLFFPF